MTIRKRRRAVAVFMAAGLVFAACGDSQSSSGSNSARTKNAALGAAPEPAACATGVIGPNGGRVLGVSGANVIEGALRAEPIGVADPVASQKVAIDFASTYSLDGRGGWSIPAVEVYQSVKDEIFRVYGLNYFWSSTSWAPTMPILMNYGGRTDLKSAYITTVYALPIIQTATAGATCTIIPTTTTSTSTSTSTSTTSSSTTTTSTTTTIPVPTTVALSATVCTETSDCSYGNTGPGGGLVVAVYEERNSDAVSKVFVEMAPPGWDGSPDPMIGQAADVRSKLAAYKGGGFSDWRAPLESEWSRVCRMPVMPPYADTAACISGLGLGGVDYGNNQNFRYWTHEKATLPYAQSKNLRFYKVDTGGPDYSDLTPRLHPVRTWKRLRVSLTTVPTTLPTTTTTIALPPVVPWPGSTVTTCSDVGKCSLGQRTSSGGLIIEVQSSGAETVYLEMAPDGWSGSADKRDPLVDANGALQALEKFNATSAGGGWTLPIDSQLAAICHIAAGRSPATSTPCIDSRRIAAAFAAGGTDAFYWGGRGNSVAGKTDFVTGRNLGDLGGKAFVRPVRLVRYVAPTTTTTIPKSCAQGGVCKIGDISPTGGLIVDFAGFGSSMTYTELASNDWRKFVDPRSSGEPALNLAEMRSNVATFAQRTASPWKLPTDRQMRAAFLFFANNPTFGPDCTAKFSSWRTLTIGQQSFRFGSFSYWLEAAGRVNRFDNFNSAAGAAYYDVGSDGKFSGRPFAERPYRGGGNPTPATWPANSTGCATRTIPTTTTTTVSVGCAGRGRCRIGDIGPSRGVIIGIKFGKTPGDITYTEMEVVANSRSDCQGSNEWTNCTAGGYDDFIRTRGLDGTFDDYPTVAELQTVARSAALKSKLRLLNSWYFSSTYRKTAMLTGDVNADSLGDLGRSLEINEFTMGTAVNMRGTSATTAETSTAYFRGVNIWKCQYSCK